MTGLMPPLRRELSQGMSVPTKKNSKSICPVAGSDPPGMLLRMKCDTSSESNSFLVRLDCTSLRKEFNTPGERYVGQ